MKLLDRLIAWSCRLLGIRHDELGRTALMSLYLLFVLLAYYILKPSSRALFLTRFGSEDLPFLYMAMAASGGLLAYLYSRMAVGWSLRAAVDAATALILISLIAIWQLLRLDQAWVYYLFNIWVSLFSLVLVSQGWLIAGHIFDARAAKRVYSLLAAGAVLGAAIGGSLTAAIVRALGTGNLLPVSALFVLVAYGCYRALLRQPNVSLESASATEGETKFSLGDVVNDIQRYRHLQVIVAILTVTYIVDTLVEYQFSTMARQDHSGDNLTAFLGGFYGLYLNLATFVLQIFLTSFVVNRFGVGGTLLVMPVGIGAGSIVMLLSPGVWAAGVTRLIEASTRYSFNRTGMELLYLPLPPDLRNRAKAFVDVFVDRMARGVGAVLILGLGAFAGQGLAPVTVLVLICCVIWGALAFYARSQYINSVRQRLASRRLDLESIRIPYQDSGTVRLLEQSAEKGEGRESIYALSMLEAAPNYPLEGLAIRLSSHSSADVRAHLFATAKRTGWKSLLNAAKREIELPPGPATHDALSYYAALAEDGQEALSRILSDKNRRVVEAAVEAAVEQSPAMREAVRMPVELIREAAFSADVDARRVAALAYRLYPEQARDEVPPMLLDRSSAVRRAASLTLRAQGEGAVDALARILHDEFRPLLLRSRVARALGSILYQQSADTLLSALDTHDVELRSHVLRSLAKLRERAPKLVYGDGPVRGQIYAEAQNYADMRAALSVLPSADAPHTVKLLMRTIDDRLDRSVARLFQLLGLKYPPGDIRAAYKAVQRGDAAAVSNALDFLDNILDHEMKRYVFPLLDHDDPQSADLAAARSVSAEEVLREMIRSGDLWLMTCAMTAAADLGYSGLTGEIRQSGERGGAMVSAVAASAARKLAMAASG